MLAQVVERPLQCFNEVGGSSWGRLFKEEVKRRVSIVDRELSERYACGHVRSAECALAGCGGSRPRSQRSGRMRLRGGRTGDDLGSRIPTVVHSNQGAGGPVPVIAPSSSTLNGPSQLGPSKLEQLRDHVRVQWS